MKGRAVAIGLTRSVASSRDEGGVVCALQRNRTPADVQAGTWQAMTDSVAEAGPRMQMGGGVFG